MSWLYKFYGGAFDCFINCPLEELVLDIERSEFSLMGKTKFWSLQDYRTHQILTDRLEILKLILKLRNGEITQAYFDEIVYVTK